MTMKMYAAVAVVLLVAGCGRAETAGSDTTTQVTPSTTTPSPSSPTGIASGEPIPITLVVAPGRVGPVKTGMTKAQASATGYFDTDVKVGGEECSRVEPLEWKKVYQDRVDVLTDDAGNIASMAISGNIKTTKGVGVGSTLGEVNAAYGSAISPAIEAGYSQTGVFVNSGSQWLGFLIDEDFNLVTPASKVTLMEVTSGTKPGLMRDGC